MEKLPVHEKAPFSPKTERILTLVQVLFPILAAIAAASWAVKGSLEEQAKGREQADATRIARVNDARKPFFEQQLKTYYSAAIVAGQLSSEAPESEHWQDAKRKFYALFWGELSMVEDNGVKDRMNKMEVALANFELDGSLRRQVQRQSYCLATALKASIASNWTVDFGKTDGTPTVQSSAKAPDQNYCNDPVVALPQK